MEPATASRFANALSLALIQEQGWAEVPLPETAVAAAATAAPPAASPLLRVIAHPPGALVILRADGLSQAELGTMAEAWWQRLDGKQLPGTWLILGLLFVFEAGAPAGAREAVARLSRKRTFSARRLLAGSVDLLDGTTDMKGERGLDVKGTLARILAEWRAGEARIDTNVYRQGVQAEVDRTQAFVARLAKTRPWGTWAILAACVAMFAWTELAGGSTRILTLMRFGADYGPMVRQGEWWRLVGAMFLHIGWVHLIVNMFSLLSVGMALEQFFGNARYLGMYLIAGVAGALASALSKDIVSAGASGAIFGLFGAAALLGMRYKAEIPPALRKRIAGGMVPCIAYNLIYGLSHPNIDNSAHIGGLVAGGLFAAVIPPAVTEGEEKATRSPLTTLFLVIGLVMFAIEGYVAWRAVRVPDLASGPTRTHRDPKGRYEATLPTSMAHQPGEEADNFVGPGIEFQVFLFQGEPGASIAGEKEAILEALRGAGLTVQGHELRTIGGREWLLIDAHLGEGGPARFAITARGSVCYRLRIVGGEIGFAEAKLVLDRILEGFRPVAGE